MLKFHSKKIFSIIIATLVFILVLSTMVLATDKSVVLKLSHTGAIEHHYQYGSVMFKNLVAGMTDGKVDIKIYPLDQLGSQRESVEGAQLGTVDLVLTSDVLLSTFEPGFGALNLPFLFNNYKDLSRVLDGKVGQELSDRLAEKGLIVLAYWENGFRDITNSKRPIVKPADLEGLKIRTPSGEVFVNAFNNWGANATPMSLGEVYSALQVGTIDGQENPPAHVLDRKFYEVQDYYSITHHIHVAEPLIISKNTWNSLSGEYQQILKKAATQVALWMREYVQNKNAEQIETLKTEMDMAINNADIEAFKKSSKPVYDKYKDKFGDIVTKIQKTFNK